MSLFSPSRMSFVSVSFDLSDSLILFIVACWVHCPLLLISLAKFHCELHFWEIKSLWGQWLVMIISISLKSWKIPTYDRSWACSLLIAISVHVWLNKHARFSHSNGIWCLKIKILFGKICWLVFIVILTWNLCLNRTSCLYIALGNFTAEAECSNYHLTVMTFIIQIGFGYAMFNAICLLLKLRVDLSVYCTY